MVALGAAKEYYINDTTGNDSNDGSITRPFKTIQKAFNEGRYLAQDIVVHIAPGEYAPAIINYRGEPSYALSLVGEGTAENPVIINGNDESYCIKLNNSNRRSSFSNITFKNGRNDKGGAICCQRGWTTDNVSGVTNCVFENCIATNGGGGAVYTSHFSSSFKSCVFKNCTSSANGGALAIVNAQDDSTLEDCVFLDNTSSVLGGAVYFNTPAGDGMETNTIGLIMTYCAFTNNSAYEGGAIGGLVKGAFNSSFATNSASNNGGVWYYSGYKGETYKGSHAVTNSFVSCVFEGNSATVEGGVFSFYWPKHFSFDDCHFIGNSTEGLGSVFSSGSTYFCTLSSLLVKDCLFERNVGTNTFHVRGNDNSSLWGKEHKIKFLYSRFLNNDSIAGSTIFNESRIFMNGCEFASNIGGAALKNYREADWRFTNVIYNCLFHHNTNTVNGGTLTIYPYQAEVAVVENCTFVDNVAAKTPYAIQVDEWNSTDSGCSYANLLVYGNVSTNGETGIQVSNMLKKNCVHSYLETGAAEIEDGERGNIIGNNPGFKDYAAGDYTLRASSRCRDSGLAADWMINALDIRNSVKYPRIANMIPDIGCYEYLDYSGFKILLR